MPAVGFYHSVCNINISQGMTSIWMSENIMTHLQIVGGAGQSASTNNAGTCKRKDKFTVSIFWMEYIC